MTVREALTDGAKRLKGRCETPFLDAVLMLSSAAGKSKEQIVAAYPETLAVFHVASYVLGVPAELLATLQEFFVVDVE